MYNVKILFSENGDKNEWKKKNSSVNFFLIFKRVKMKIGQQIEQALRKMACLSKILKKKEKKR